MLEYQVGSESHSSAWGKFYLKELGEWEVKEGGSYTKHERYTELVTHPPDGTIFTVFAQHGDKRGTQAFDFYICETRPAGDTLSNQITGGCYGKGGWVRGNFMILCRGEGKIRAPRLMDWWNKRSALCGAFLTPDNKLRRGTKKRFAFWCAEHIEQRGLKDLPPMPADYDPPAMTSSIVYSQSPE